MAEVCESLRSATGRLLGDQALQNVLGLGALSVAAGSLGIGLTASEHGTLALAAYVAAAFFFSLALAGLTFLLAEHFGATFRRIEWYRHYRFQWPIARVQLQRLEPPEESIGRATDAHRDQQPPANRNEGLITLVDEYVGSLSEELDPELPDGSRRGWQGVDDKYSWARLVAIGEEHLVLSQLSEALFELRLRCDRERASGEVDRRSGLRELRSLQHQATDALTAAGESLAQYDRTDWLLRIRALLRHRRNQGLRLLRLDNPFDDRPSDLFSQLEEWALGTSDLLLDAYGPGPRERFRDQLRAGGIGAFEPAIRELGHIIERADQMRLIDTFRFEDWESRMPASTNAPSREPE